MTALAYLGTPELAVPPLRALVGAGHQVVLVVTRPDTRRGRGGAVAPSPVKRAALELGLTVRDRLEDLVGSGAELGVVVAYGRIIPSSVLDALPLVNLHFSLLPRWRGAAPVERAILAGDPTTGVCVMAVDEGLDTGPVFACQEVAVGADDLATVRDRLVEVGSGLLVRLLAGGPAGLPEPVPQRGEPTYAEKLAPHEYELHWDRPADELLRVVRLGRAFTVLDGHRLRVLAAEPAGSPGPPDRPPGTLVGDVVTTGDGGLRLVRVQPEGRRPMSGADWLRGRAVPEGAHLGP